MGRGRAPCCDKTRVKKGAWSQAEDLRLTSFIQKKGHDNWRALPKQAGLLRCGKSCRLRWMNYLRPDIRRGNFTQEEEESIIKLHEFFGNKWSKIAAQLPGRTDNEIKNVWHTHLKKRLIVKECNSSSTTSVELNESLKNYHQPSSNDHQSIPSSLSGSSVSTQIEHGHVRNQTSSHPNMFETIQLSSPSSNSHSSHDAQISHTNLSIPESNIDVMEDNLKTQNGYEELTEIPFEPNLDFWDLLDADFINVVSQVPVSEVQTHQSMIFEEEDKREGESWWWLAYLEKELGLEATI
ncbi:hypothetical protein F0562_028317 [Nyssa sinensis]|uniref:Uncharacterized protein n=1 Tax=Nyssa sinensis TaxID=561372 RepID=A0A5J5B9T0_9ASTE|nr:hypothetical protein F0562_028317 [Nyssa sinensis]